MRLHMQTVKREVGLPVELVTKILKDAAATDVGRRPTRIVELVCISKAHQRALERLLYDTTVLLSSSALEVFAALAGRRAACGAPLRVRALSVSGHDGTEECSKRFLDLIALLAPALARLHAGCGYTVLALQHAAVQELYLDEYADGHFTQLAVPDHAVTALTSLWLGPFVENASRLALVLAMMPNLQQLGLIFMPCRPLMACQILDACNDRGIGRVHFIVQEWSLGGTLLSKLRLQALLDAHAAARGIKTLYTVATANPEVWGIGPHRAAGFPKLWLGDVLGEIELGSGDPL